MKIKPLLLSLIASLLILPASAQTTNPSATAAKIPYGNNPDVGKYATIRGFNMYYEVYGTGKTVAYDSR